MTDGPTPPFGPDDGAGDAEERHRPRSLRLRGEAIELDGRTVRTSVAALARAAGLPPSTVRSRMKAHGIGAKDAILAFEARTGAMPVTFEGEAFASHNEAARVLGRRHGASESAASKWIRAGVPSHLWRGRSR